MVFDAKSAAHVIQILDMTLVRVIKGNGPLVDDGASFDGTRICGIVVAAA